MAKNTSAFERPKHQDSEDYIQGFILKTVFRMALRTRTAKKVRGRPRPEKSEETRLMNF